MLRLFLALAAAAAVFGWTSTAHAGSIPWCGSGEPTTDLADDVSAFEWHIVYALPSDGVDRFGSYAPRFAGDVAAISNWWLAQDSTRRPRFDLVAAPGCSSEPYGRVDISLVRLPHPNGEYDYARIVADVRAAGFGSPDKGYLIYYDGSEHVATEFGLCGQGGTDRTAFAYAIVYVGSCQQSFNDDLRAVVAAHEMTHGMGAVPSQAPHVCESSHVCDNPDDVMKALLRPGDSLNGVNLDAARDDYYGHSGNWWDVQDSGLLYKLDIAQDASLAIANLTATNDAGVVSVTWSVSPLTSGVRYRVYDETGAMIRDDPSSTLETSGEVGQTLTWTLRAWNLGGFLSPPATIHFKVGYGIVDAAGTLVKDTVRPNQVERLRATRAPKKQVLLRWSPVTDPIGLKGYRVSAPGMKTIVVRTASAKVNVHGKTVTVAAVDQAGNVGPAATVRAPR